MFRKLCKDFAQNAVTFARCSSRKMSMKTAADPRFFTLFQHAQAKQLDYQRKSGVLSHKIEVHGVRLHFEMTGSGDHTVLLLPGALAPTGSGTTQNYKGDNYQGKSLLDLGSGGLFINQDKTWIQSGLQISGGSSQTDFSQQLSNYNKDDFTLIAMDPRGYGRSRPPDRDWPLEFLQRDAEDAMELVRKLNIDKVSILGWSDGGITAMIAAARYPEMVDKLVVWGSNTYITEKDMEIYNGIRDISKWSEKMRNPFLYLYGEEYFKEHWNNWIDAFQNYVEKRNGDICKEEIKNIKAPTLIIHGRKDPVVPLEHADYVHHNIKQSRLYIMPESKHNLHIRYYREFNFLTEQFLKQSTNNNKKPAGKTN